jgi:hypothetical protein
MTMPRPGVPRLFPGSVIAGLSQPAGNRPAAGQMWWGGGDSNPGPTDYESAALTG